MATLNGVAATGIAKTIPTLQEEGQYGGKIRSLYDTYVLLADLAVNDIINMGGKLPEGARLVDAILTVGALGGSCTLDVGWAVSDDAAEAASAASIFAAIAASSAGVTAAHGASGEPAAFYQYVLKGAVQPQVKCHAVSSGATGKSISLDIRYIVD